MAGHGLIVGQTMSGKTTLARSIARQHRDAGRGVLVLDPLFDEGLQSIADWSTDDPQLFLDTVWRNRNCTLIIDEAGEVIGQYAGVLQRLATQARHLGHLSIFSTQRPMQISKTIRAQCGWIAAFAVCTADAQGLAEDFNAPCLYRAPALQKGQYFLVRRFSDPIGGHVFGGALPIVQGGRKGENLLSGHAKTNRITK